MTEEALMTNRGVKFLFFAPFFLSQYLTVYFCLSTITQNKWQYPHTAFLPLFPQLDSCAIVQSPTSIPLFGLSDLRNVYVIKTVCVCVCISVRVWGLSLMDSIGESQCLTITRSLIYSVHHATVSLMNQRKYQQDNSKLNIQGIISWLYVHTLFTRLKASTDSAPVVPLSGTSWTLHRITDEAYARVKSKSHNWSGFVSAV